jgi:hypothetical protein
MERPSSMPVRALCQAIHVGKGDVPDKNRGDGLSNEDGLAERVRSYAGEAHRGLVTCHGDEPGKLDTKSFTASGLSKITLPNGCSAETDTHIFAAADDGFDRAETDYIVAYVWPFDPLTLTPGLDTKKFSEILRRNLTNLANNTRHNIPLEIALQAVGAEYGVPMDLNQVLDKHHYVTVTVTVLILIVGGTILVILGVIIIAGRRTRGRRS